MNNSSARPLAAVHLDLDGARHIFDAHGCSYPFCDDPLALSGIRGALEFFQRTGITATFFVIGEDLLDRSLHELLREAVRQNHEVASHTWSHRKLTALGRDEKRREIFESREAISSRLDCEVHGFRAPGFAIDRECLELVDEAGYRYDSSLFPGRQSEFGAGVHSPSIFPNHPLPDKPLMELPMPQHSPLPFPFHPCYSLIMGDWYFRAGLSRFRRTGAPLILLFHLTDFADRLPENRLPGWKLRFYTLSHLDAARKRMRCERMLERVRESFEIVPTCRLIESYEGHSVGKAEGKEPK